MWAGLHSRGQSQCKDQFTCKSWKSQELKQIRDVLSPKRFILEALRKASVIECDNNKGDPCFMHPGALHDVERCPIDEELL